VEDTAFAFGSLFITSVRFGGSPSFALSSQKFDDLVRSQTLYPAELRALLSVIRRMHSIYAATLRGLGAHSRSRGSRWYHKSEPHILRNFLPTALFFVQLRVAVGDVRLACPSRKRPRSSGVRCFLNAGGAILASACTAGADSAGSLSARSKHATVLFRPERLAPGAVCKISRLSVNESGTTVSIRTDRWPRGPDPYSPYNRPSSKPAAVRAGNRFLSH